MGSVLCAKARPHGGRTVAIGCPYGLARISVRSVPMLNTSATLIASIPFRKGRLKSEFFHVRRDRE